MHARRSSVLLALAALASLVLATSERASACTVDAAVPVLRTPLDAPIPIDGGLVLSYAPRDDEAAAPPASALALVRDRVRIGFTAREVAGALVYAPDATPAPGAWRLEGWRAPRELTFVAAELLDAPREVRIRAWESGAERTWHERVAWATTPETAERVEVAWRFGEARWSERVDREHRGFSFHGRDAAARALRGSGGCELGHAPRVGVRAGDVAQVRWIDRWGRPSAWSAPVRVSR